MTIARGASIDTARWITLRWIRGSRYYRVHLEQDMWRHWLITRVNGRIGSPLGRVRAVPMESIESAFLTLAALTKRQRRRGYTLDG